MIKILIIKTKAGFTLAEVLITLLIIGVISSIVIPSLISNTQDAEYKATLKKVYSDLSQATKMVMMDNGGTIKGLCSDNGDDCLRDKYLSYLSYVKKCNEGTSGCFDFNGFKFLSGTLSTWGADSTAILNNGVLLDFYYPANSSTCTGTWGSTLQHCGVIFLDVNGSKKPNTLGKDTFILHIMENTLKPYGTQGDGVENDCNTSPPSGDGYGCAAAYLKN